MPLKIIENSKPKLPKIKMLCDNIIDPKLQEFPAINTCFGTSSTTLVSGGTGSGKSTFVLQLMKTVFKRCFHSIYLVIPENSYKSIDPKDNIYAKHLDPENIYHDYSVETLMEITSKIEDDASDGYFSLLIIDDYANQYKNKAEAKLLESLFLKNRHLRLSAFILAQNFFQVPKIVREICNNCILFNTNKSQNLKFYEQMFNGSKSDFDELMKLMPTTHDYLLCSLKHKKIFYNWDEIVLSD
jgi:hypothetical protein